MLEDINGNVQPAAGTTGHWAMLAAVQLDPVVYGPLQTEVIRIVADAIAANPAGPYISSRHAGADALEQIGSRWHAEFPRRFRGLPNGAERGLFGMALWNYLVAHPDTWRFTSVADPYGHGQDAKEYWRI